LIMHTSECLICSGHLGPSGIPGLLRCSACTFQTADLNITTQDVEALYTEKYFNGDEYASYLADRNAIERSLKRKLQTLLNYVQDPERRNLFEVGCAYGLFMNIAQRHFQHVSGIDISHDAVEYARSQLHVDAIQGDLLSTPLPERIDVACLWDTIEHLSQPQLYLEKLSAAMPKGAVIAITTGDIDSTVARWRGKKWRQIHPPTHLQYFSKNTLTKLLEKYGFGVRHVGFDGMYRNLESMSYTIFALKRKQVGIHSALKRFGLLRGDLYLNLRDIIFVIAEKQA